MKGDN